MGSVLTTVDLIVFFGSLIAVMAIGLWAGRKEDTSEDYYLAGRSTRWWGVAGSIFGSNVSANHLVGMMGVGFMFGFAQSHFEVTAICGLLMLCYVFLPMYRKLKLFTLSEYLGRRYNDASRVSYALIMVTIMVVIQMVPGFYIGSRSVNLLLQGDTGKKAIAQVEVNEAGAVTGLKLAAGGYGYVEAPKIVIALPPNVRDEDSGQRAEAEAVLTDGKVTSLRLTNGGKGYSADTPPKVSFKGGSSVNAEISPGDVDPMYYTIGIILMALVTGTYTIFGGLKAVIVTDVIQSVLLLFAGLLVAFITFSQPEVGGWSGMVAQDLAMPDGKERLHLYNPSDHPGLPWSGVLTGLMVLHFYYWGTNQFIVQRALSAKTDGEARLGIISAGFFKLLIPFFSIGTGIAAYFYFKKQNMDVAQDVVFINLLTKLVAPIGFGLVGLIAAGMIGAILSSLDSMMNSAATIFTFDIYKKYINPNASEKTLILTGRLCIVVCITLAAYITIATMGANSEESFFLHVASHQGKLIAGVVVAFLLGMMWKGASSVGSFFAIVVGVALSYSMQPLYEVLVDSYRVEVNGLVEYEGLGGSLVEMFGVQLNFFHAVFVAAIASLIVHVVLSLLFPPNEEQSKLTWLGQGIFKPSTLRNGWIVLIVTLVVYGILGALSFMTGEPAEPGGTVERLLQPTFAAWIAACWTFVVFAVIGVNAIRHDENRSMSAMTVIKEDRFWGGLLAACAIFMMYYFI